MAAEASRAASGATSLEPVAASVLAEREAARRDGLKARGPLGSGCRGLDEYVLMGGGFERGSVVGVSADDEEGFGLVLGLQVVARWLCGSGGGRALVVTPKPAGALLAALREGIAGEVAAAAAAGEGEGGDGEAERQRRRRVGACLDRVLVSCVFDVDGLCEVLAELEGGDASEGAVSEVADSQDEDDDDDRASTPPPPPPGIVVVAHLSSLLTGLFAQREPSAAHAALDHLSRRLRALARAPPSGPLVMLLNSTTPAPSRRAPDPTLRSVFAPPPPPPPPRTAPACYHPNSGGGSNHHHHHHHHTAHPPRPAFGLVFARLLDLHLLCTPVVPPPASAPGDPESPRALVVVVEVLVDHLGLWQGRRAPRPSREQRWAPVRVVAGRVVDALSPVP